MTVSVMQIIRLRCWYVRCFVLYVLLKSNMDMKTVIPIGEFLVSTPGFVCTLALRILLAAFFICSGIQIFDFKKNLLSLAGEG